MAGYRRSGSERLGDHLVRLFVIFTVAVTLLPFVYIVSMSLSNPVNVARGNVWFWPRGWSVHAYRLVIQSPGFWRAYYNTIVYTVLGTFVNVALTVLGAYALSRPNLVGRRLLTWMVIVPLFFNGGLVPTFLLVNSLGFYNTRWAMILPTAVNSFLVLVTRGFFRAIPESLIEAPRIDGANDWKIFTHIVLPLSKPILAVLTLFYAVFHWNDYFNALIYLPDTDLQPLSIFLSKVVIQDDRGLLRSGGLTDPYAQITVGTQMKYALIVVTVLPIVVGYPWVLKHFKEGMLVGSVKA